ncbi:hypothetical protein CHUAL_000952 [Chamberlinius hualienensis]
MHAWKRVSQGMRDFRFPPYPISLTRNPLCVSDHASVVSKQNHSTVGIEQQIGFGSFYHNYNGGNERGGSFKFSTSFDPVLFALHRYCEDTGLGACLEMVDC